MAKTTTNYGLIKPERSDNYSVDVMGENMDIIDEKLGVLEPLSVIQVDENQNVTFPGNVNIGGNIAATSLNTTVTVGYTSDTVDITTNYTPICPFVPGVIYSGVINCSVSNSANLYIKTLSTSGTWTTTSHTSGDFSFSNVLAVYVYNTNNRYQNPRAYIKEPTFTVS